MTKTLNLSLPDAVYNNCMKDVHSGLALNIQDRIRKIISDFYEGRYESIQRIEAQKAEAHP